MKPKFALDLSHEGINLLHRSKGGWSLVGSVDLDDPEMGAHLADLRRRAAALESGGLTCKIIIPNSQVLYTTIEAPGPDDISREVQIRSGLDGLTPYPVGELVFDWRAAGERARVAVLARETMDEAETFAVEHQFNPVSFVARSPQGEFSGEPFFGKTRAATKILGPTERVEPDASPVPRKPPAIDPRPATGSPFGPTTARTPAPAPAPDSQAGPHSPGELAWQPLSEPAAAPTPEPTREPARAVDPAPGPRQPRRPEPDPVDDPFAELDAIQAELSGDPDAMAAFRPRPSQAAARSQDRPPQTDRGADQPTPPPLAPFPPTSDEAEAMPAPAQPTRKPRTTAKTAAPTKASEARPAPNQSPGSGPGTGPRTAPATSPGKTAPGGGTGPQTARATSRDGGQPAQPPTGDDVPAQPGVAFSTRRGGDGATTTATPSARNTAPKPAQGTPSGQPTQPPGRGAGNQPAPGDRRRADMADALSRPLPQTPTGGDLPKAPEKPGGRGSLSDAVRGAAGGLRSFGQRRSSGKDEAKPGDSSMAALMRGAGSSEARISPDQYEDDPDERAADTARGATPDKPTPATPPPAARTSAPGAPAAQPDRRTSPATAKAAPAKAAPAKATPPATPEMAPKPAAKPAPATTPDKPPVLPSAAPAKPKQAKAAVSDAEALTVFGARRTEETRGRRKYLGLILTLVLLLAMAIIAMWSSFFVEDGDPALLTPGEDAAAPETPVAPETVPPDATPVPDADPDTDVLPDDAPPQETGPEAAAPAIPDTAPVPQVLTGEEADALYAETQVWQRAPEALGDPFAPALEMGALGDPGTARGVTADPSATPDPGLPAPPDGDIERATPLSPPPADTVFELDENGLVNPSPEGTVSPGGVIIYEGAPAAVPPVRPAAPALPDTTPEDAALDDAALEQAVEQAVEAAAAVTTDTPPADALPDLPDVRPEPRPDDAPAPDTDLPEAATPEDPAAEPADTDAADPDNDARLDGAPAEAPTDPATATATTDATPEAGVETAAADPGTIENVVDAVATDFVDATELAVATSVKPTRRPADIDQIVNAAMARAAAAPPEPAAPATTTPAIPTSASVADQATTPNAIDLGEINLLGVSGPTNARRALVRMANGRYITVKTGDRLDGGRVTSITSDGLTYQKGARNFTLQLLPLG